MKKDSIDTKINDFFSVRIDKEVAILRFRENMLLPLIDSINRDRLINHIDKLSREPSIKVILMLHNPYKTGYKDYFNFYRNLTVQEADRNILYMLGNVVNRLILNIVKSDKFFIHAGSGETISMILNIGLACDYRIVGEDTLFHNPYIDLGVLPKGGGPFFLLHKLGRSKAYEMLLFRKTLSAREALKLGILDKIVPNPGLEEAALKAAHRFGQIPSRTLSGIKKLVNYSIQDLEDYLKTENQEIWKISEGYLRNHYNQLDGKFKAIEI